MMERLPHFTLPLQGFGFKVCSRICSMPSKQFCNQSSLQRPAPTALKPHRTAYREHSHLVARNMETLKGGSKATLGLDGCSVPLNPMEDENAEC